MMRKLIWALSFLAVLVILMPAVTPPAQAGVLWAGLGYPLYGYVYPYQTYAVVPSYVYQPYPYYFGGWGYYGYARDVTTFYRYGVVYGYPWVWGFWDPPNHGDINSIIRYDEIFTGLDNDGNAIGLDGLAVTGNTILDNNDSSEHIGSVIETTFDQLPFLVDPTNVSNLELYLGDAIENHPHDTVYFSSVSVPISAVSTPAPEPGTYLLCGLGLMAAGLVRRRRRSRAPTG